MGNAASKDDYDDCVEFIGPEPNLDIDSCDVDSGAAYYIPGMCLAGYKGRMSIDYESYNIYRDQMCGRLGNVDGEWSVAPSDRDVFGGYIVNSDIVTYPCSSDSCNMYKIHNQDEEFINPNNCCLNRERGCSTTVPGWGCSTEGLVAPCMRGNPLGSPLLCCFNDRDGTNDRSACYVTQGNNRNTCNKCQRDITSNNDQSVSITQYSVAGAPISESLVPCSDLDNKSTYGGYSGCQDIAFYHCLGEDLPANDTSWIYRWINQDGSPREYKLNEPSCHYALLRNIGVPSTTIQAQLNAPSTNSCFPQPITSPDPQDLRWAQLLMNAVLAKYRRQGYTIPSPVNSPGYSLFQQYLKNYVCCRYPIVCQQGLEASCRNLDIDTVSSDIELADWCGCYMANSQYEEYVDNFGVNKTCTPPCNRNSSIKQVNIDNSYIPCTQGVCIIDDVTINIANSSGGEINFEQFCTGCGQVEGDGLSSGGNCSCIINDATIEVANSRFGEISIQNKCGTIQCSDQEGNVRDCQQESISTFWWNVAYIIIAIIIVLLFIILCLYLITLNSERRTSKTVVIRRRVPPTSSTVS